MVSAMAADLKPQNASGGVSFSGKS